MFYGNLFVAKLLEFKHFGKGTFTDMGTTYKMMRRDCLKRILPNLDPTINMSFNAYFLDKVLQMDEVIIECPITFYKRVGESKGGNVNNLRALKVGFEMIRGVLIGWPEKRKL